MVRADGGYELRQSSDVQLVITGQNLAGTTAVYLGAGPTLIDSATATEVRVSAYSGAGAPIGPIVVTLVAPGGTTALPAALTLTPHVIAAGAPGGGRGTYESPMQLCEAGGFPGPSPGDTLELSSGLHTCGGLVVITGGVTVNGAPDGAPGGPTIVQGDANGGFGFHFFFSGPQRATTVRDLTFEAPLAENSVFFADTHLVLEDIIDAGGVRAHHVDSVSIDHYVFDGPVSSGNESAALRILAGQLALTDVVVHCQPGVAGSLGDGIFIGPRNEPFPEGEGSLERVRVEHCGRGLVVGWEPGPFIPPSNWAIYQASSLELLDNETGMFMFMGSMLLLDPVIRGDHLTPLVSSYGIEIRDGDVTLLGGKINTVATGIDLYTTSFGGPMEPASDLVADGTEIVGGQYGISFHGFDNNSDLTMRRCIVREQTEASVRVDGYDSYFDLGSAFESGDNALSVLSGYALEDVRTDSLNERYIDAIGTTLNGRSYAGQTVEGPATLSPDYKIHTASGAIRF